MQVLTDPKLVEIETHFHLFTVTNRPDFKFFLKKGSFALPAKE